MFGTLVIQLPSNYTGGQLIVYHQSKNKKFDFSGHLGCCNFHYAAFYADCQHEIKPVTSGYRLCLVYNLVHTGCGPSPMIPDDKKAVSAIVSHVRKWNEDKGHNQMMAYMLEHQYSRASLSFKSLKNSDRVVANLLVSAKKNVDFDLFVAHVCLSETWDACGFDSFDYEEESIIETTVTAEHLKSIEGKSFEHNIVLDKECLVPEDFFDDRDPDDEDVHVTGNEGVTVDKQYNWAAILLWPSKNRIQNLGLENVVHVLKEDVQKHPNSADVEVFAKDIVGKCMLPEYLGCIHADTYVSLFQSLQILGNVKLLSKFLNNIASSSRQEALIGNVSFSNEILNSGKKLGWNVLRSPLQSMFDKISVDCKIIEDYSLFLFRISQQPFLEDQKDICCSLAKFLVKVLSNQEDKGPTPPSFWTHLHPSSFHASKDFLVSLFKCLVSLECNDQLTTLIKALVSKPNRYPVVETIAPLCEGMYKELIEGKGEGKSLLQLLSYSISSLEARINSGPKESKPITLTCSCKDCLELVTFLNNPVEREGRFKMAQKRRNHLLVQLSDKMHLVSVNTKYVGSPHTLVVTKKAGCEGNSLTQKENAALTRFQSMTSFVSRYLSIVERNASGEDALPAKRVKTEP